MDVYGVTLWFDVGKKTITTEGETAFLFASCGLM